MIKVDLSGAAGFFDPAGPDYAAAAQAHRTLLEHTGAGADFTGWLDLPERMQSGELKQILAAASRIRGRSQALVVVGIGGSYLGAKGALELLRPRPQPGDPKILFAGNSLSPDALMHLLEELGDLDFDLNVVSKSGTTLEPALAFRMFRGLLEAKYGPEKAKKHIFATTDAHRGVLKHMAKQAEIIRPKFEGMLTVLKAELSGLGIAEWNEPRGGYFIAAELLSGTARRTVALCREAGLTLTGAGSVYPYGKDPADSVLRIAPTFAPLAEIPAAAELFCISARLAAAEKLLCEKES